MFKLLIKRAKKLKNDLETVETQSKNPTVMGQTREKLFRQFINDIFPYYDAFKGDVFGKNCDFVLADKNEHPRFDTLADYKNYATVVSSLVDTVLDLKGDCTSRNIKEGIAQAFTTKSKIRKDTIRKVFNHEDNNLIYIIKKIIRHGLIFVKGPDFNKTVLNTLLKELETVKGDGKINIDIDDTNFEKFYKLPDFFYSIETDEIIVVEKSLEPKITFFKEAGILILVMFLEKFSNERDNTKLRNHLTQEIIATSIEGEYRLKRINLKFAPNSSFWKIKESVNKTDRNDTTIKTILNFMNVREK